MFRTSHLPKRQLKHAIRITRKISPLGAARLRAATPKSSSVTLSWPIGSDVTVDKLFILHFISATQRGQQRFSALHIYIYILCLSLVLSWYRPRPVVSPRFRRRHQSNICGKTCRIRINEPISEDQRPTRSAGTSSTPSP